MEKEIISAPWISGIPNDWRNDRLKDLVPRIVGGGTPSSSEPEFWYNGDIVWVTPTDFSRTVDSSEISDSERKITRAGLYASSATLLPKGAVIMASRATIGAVRIAGTELATNQGFISFVCDERRLHNRFLYYVVLSILGPYFAETAPGTTFSEISRGKAKLEKIGFPTLSEQKRIAVYLDETCIGIGRAIEAKQQQISVLQEVRKSEIQRTVTRGLNSHTKLRRTSNVWMSELPENWNLVALKRVSTVQTGLTLGKQYQGPLVERPYLRVANVQDGHLDLREVTTIEVPEYVAKGVELKVDDVLMTEGGDLDKLGRGFLWNGEIPDCLHQNHIFAVRCFRHKLLPKFLTYLTASRYGRDYFEATGKRTTNLASTNSTKVGQFPIPLPSLSEQAAICNYLDTKAEESKALIQAIESQILTLAAYRKSSIHECVTGKRRVTDEDVRRASRKI